MREGSEKNFQKPFGGPIGSQTDEVESWVLKADIDMADVR